MSQQAAESYLGYLIEGNAEAIIGLLAGDPSIEDPIGGSLLGQHSVTTFVENRHQWLAEHNAEAEHLRSTTVPARTVVEYTLHLDLDGERYPLPYAVVGEHTADGKLDQIRVYHSMWPLIGEHEVRSAILSPAHDHELVPVVAKYQKALKEGDAATIVTTFEEDGYFREPAGGPHFYRGMERLTQFMEMILAPGGIGLEHCTITDDGVACALEFNAVTFGNEALIPQAGVAIYERGDSGLLHAARIYDDVNVEALAGTI